MKIVGITYWTGAEEMILKNDSCLLNNRKPMFVPEGTKDLRASECIVLRVSRLGKGISELFAERYYDAVAFGIDFVAMDVLEHARTSGRSWTSAYGFDYSLAVGDWIKKEEISESEIEEAIGQLTTTINEAISRVSKDMTIRQGDLIYITAKRVPEPVEQEQIISKTINGEEILYCRIK